MAWQPLRFDMESLRRPRQSRATRLRALLCIRCCPVPSAVRPRPPPAASILATGGTRARPRLAPLRGCPRNRRRSRRPRPGCPGHSSHVDRTEAYVSSDGCTPSRQERQARVSARFAPDPEPAASARGPPPSSAIQPFPGSDSSPRRATIPPVWRSLPWKLGNCPTGESTLQRNRAPPRESRLRHSLCVLPYAYTFSTPRVAFYLLAVSSPRQPPPKARNSEASAIWRSVRTSISAI